MCEAISDVVAADLWQGSSRRALSWFLISTVKAECFLFLGCEIFDCSELWVRSPHSQSIQDYLSHDLTGLIVDLEWGGVQIGGSLSALVHHQITCFPRFGRATWKPPFMRNKQRAVFRGERACVERFIHWDVNNHEASRCCFPTNPFGSGSQQTPKTEFAFDWFSPCHSSCFSYRLSALYGIRYGRASSC